MEKKLIITKNNIPYVALFDEDQIASIICEATKANMINSLFFFLVFLNKYNFTIIESKDYPYDESYHVYEVDDRKVLIIDPDVTERVVDVFQFIMRELNKYLITPLFIYW